MKKSTLILSILLPLQLFSQSFEEVFSPGNGTTILQRDDSSFIVSTFSLANGILEISPAGDSLSFKDFPYCGFQKMIKSYGDGFLATGILPGPGLGSCLIRLDSNLDTLWMKTYLPGSSSFGMEIIELADSSILLTISESGGMSSYNCYLLHLDVDGNILWQTNPTFSKSVVNNISSNHNLVYRAVNDEGGFLQLTCYNGLTGDTVWEKKYNQYTSHGMDFKPFSNSIVVSDSGLYIGGNVTSDSAGVISMQEMIFKTDLNGDSVWLQTYLPGTFTKIISTSAQNYYCIGTALDSVILFGADDSGTMTLSKNFRRYDFAYPSELISTTDSGFALCGFAQDTTTHINYSYVVRTDSSGIVEIVTAIPEVSNFIVDYSYNNNDRRLKINFDELEKGMISAEIYSISGQLLLEKKLSDKTNVLDLNSLTTGGYFVVVKRGTANISQYKFLIY